MWIVCLQMYVVDPPFIPQCSSFISCLAWVLTDYLLRSSQISKATQPLWQPHSPRISHLYRINVYFAESFLRRRRHIQIALLKRVAREAVLASSKVSCKTVLPSCPWKGCKFQRNTASCQWGHSCTYDLVAWPAFPAISFSLVQSFSFRYVAPATDLPLTYAPDFKAPVFTAAGKQRASA